MARLVLCGPALRTAHTQVDALRWHLQRTRQHGQRLSPSPARRFQIDAHGRGVLLHVQVHA
jgi:hypothetical protein